MIASIDIENEKTKKVKTIYVKVLKNENNKNLIFDISELNKEDLELLKNAIDDDMPFTDIELFFIDEETKPNFGPDYNWKIENYKLILTLIPKKRKKHIKEKNDDWTIHYEDKFLEIAYKFLNSDCKYLIIYNENGIKGKFLKEKPKDDIFMNLFFNNNYNMIALFKKKRKTNLNNVRDCLEYINSYCENDEIEERRENNGMESKHLRSKRI